MTLLREIRVGPTLRLLPDPVGLALLEASVYSQLDGTLIGTASLDRSELEALRDAIEEALER